MLAVVTELGPTQVLLLTLPVTPTVNIYRCPQAVGQVAVREYVPTTVNEVVSVDTVCPLDQVGVPVVQAVVSDTLWPTLVVSEVATTVGVFVMVAVRASTPVSLLIQPLALIQYT